VVWLANLDNNAQDLVHAYTLGLQHICPLISLLLLLALLLLLTGVGTVACYSQPLSAACSCSIGPLAVSSSGALEHQQQQQYLWEEGIVYDPDWCKGAAVQASLPPMFQLQAHVSCTQQGNSNSSSSKGSSGLTTAGAAHQVEAVACETCAVPFATPALQLQQQWAVSLQGAVALTHTQQPLLGPQPPEPTDRQQSQMQEQTHHQQQQQRQCRAMHSQSQGGQGGHGVQTAPGWLRKLLGANAAVPLEQLTQLDLSLEQLPGLHGLDALCPQLTSMAVNMNGLSSLQGLEGCTGLMHLSAQVGWKRAVRIALLAADGRTTCHNQAGQANASSHSCVSFASCSLVDLVATVSHPAPPLQCHNCQLW
jgi:hypothetical protein